MSQHIETTIRYDGPALRDHEMDVQDLAPALLALAQLVQIANFKFNGNRASMRVLVNADTEQKCFQLDLSLVQSLLDHAQMALGKDNIATAKEIAAIIGFVGGPLSGLFALYKFIHGRGEVTEGGVSFHVNEATGTTIVHIHGDGNSVEISNRTAELAADTDVMKQVKAVLQPLKNKDYEDFTILHKAKPVVQIHKEEAEYIISASPAVIDEDCAEDATTFAAGPAWVDTSHFRGAAKWVLLWAGQKVDAKMPDDFLNKFQNNEIVVVPNAKLTVKMKIMAKVDERGVASGPPSYIVEEVQNIELPPKAARQIDFFGDDRS